MNITKIVAMAIVFMAAFASTANAANVYSQFTITGFLLTEKVGSDGSVNFGGCMVRVSPSPKSLWNECENTYLSLSCSGVFGTKAGAQSVLSTAQLAYVLGKPILATVETANQHNGFCVAHTMQILP